MTNCECAAMGLFAITSSILYFIKDEELEQKLIKFSLVPLVMWGIEDFKTIWEWINYYTHKEDAFERPT